MSTFVLVHGAWAGEWCWDKVVPLLKESGHKVETLKIYQDMGRTEPLSMR